MIEARSFDPTILVPPDHCVAVVPHDPAAMVVRDLLRRPEVGADERGRQSFGGTEESEEPGRVRRGAQACAASRRAGRSRLASTAPDYDCRRQQR